MIRDVIIFIIIVIISSASIITDSNYMMMILTLLLFILVKKDRVVKPIIFILVGGIIAINLITMVLFETQIELLRIINFIISPVLLSYFIVLYFGVSFWNKFESIVFKLTCLSLVLFLLDILFPNIFYSLSSVFKYITSDSFKQEHYWTSFFYVHCCDTRNILDIRNAGFMWEPGAFAFILILCISINWLRYGVSYKSKRFIIYSIALISTFSTSGYLAYAILFVSSFFSERRNILAYLLLLFLIFGALQLYSEVDFLGAEISRYIDALELDYTDYTTEGFSATKLNRFMYAKYQLIEIFKHPFGYGIFRATDIKSMWDFVGVNGLTDMLFMYGIPMFALIMYVIFNFFKTIGRNKITPIVIGSFAAVLIMIFSNPVSHNPIVYIIIFTPLLISSKTFKIYEYLSNINISIPRRISPNK